jgi:hypothetical protein
VLLADEYDVLGDTISVRVYSARGKKKQESKQQCAVTSSVEDMVSAFLNSFRESGSTCNNHIILVAWYWKADSKTVAREWILDS